jgi:hypothetical protein
LFAEFTTVMPVLLPFDWVVRYDNRLLQLEGQSGHPRRAARSTVLVRAAADGTLEIRNRDRVMRWTETLARAAAETGPARPSPVTVDPNRPRRTRPRHAGDDHPWRVWSKSSTVTSNWPRTGAPGRA